MLALERDASSALANISFLGIWFGILLQHVQEWKLTRVSLPNVLPLHEVPHDHWITSMATLHGTWSDCEPIVLIRETRLPLFYYPTILAQP